MIVFYYNLINFGNILNITLKGAYRGRVVVWRWDMRIKDFRFDIYCFDFDFLAGGGLRGWIDLRF